MRECRYALILFDGAPTDDSSTNLDSAKSFFRTSERPFIIREKTINFKDPATKSQGAYTPYFNQLII